MNFLACFLLLGTAALFVAAASSSSHPAEKFREHKNKFFKKYSGTEALLRLALFTLVDQEIEEHNRDPNKTYEKGHNHMSDWTQEEKSKLNGGIRAGTPSNIGDHFTADKQGRDAYPTSLNLATSTNCVGPVKNQGQCGSCYAFAAIANLEYSYCMLHSQTYVSLSEQQVVDCDNEQESYYGPTRGGCKGGSEYLVWQYLIKTGGSQSTCAYGAYTSGTTGTNSTCKFSPWTVQAKIASRGYLFGNASSMVAALNTKGVISVYLYATSNFNAYKSGIFSSDPLCPPCVSQSNCPVNHAVVIVGYDNENGIDFWIVRNSYGASWGEAGYIRVKKGINLCNIENGFEYVVAQQ